MPVSVVTPMIRPMQAQEIPKEMFFAAVNQTVEEFLRRDARFLAEIGHDQHQNDTDDRRHRDGVLHQDHHNDGNERNEQMAALFQRFLRLGQ